MQDKEKSITDKKYLFVPFSIINQRWFKSEAAVRAWFFYAWQSLLPHWKEHQSKTIKGKKFYLSEGETICTRSFLAKSLKINDNTAKGSTDKLKRTNTISVTQEYLNKYKESYKNKISRVKVNGVPVPDEPYLKMIIPTDHNNMWEEKGLAQLYIYLLCRAKQSEVYTVAGAHAKLLKVGDVVVSYTELKDVLKCKEGNLKKNLKKLVEVGAITRERIGNRGILVHLNYYELPDYRKYKKNKKQKYADNQQKQQKNQNEQPSQNNAIKEAYSVPQKVVFSATPSNKEAKIELNNSSVTIPDGVVQTPITKAVAKYYFGRVRGAKDVGTLNVAIKGLWNKILQKPLICPVETFIDAAMDEFLRNHSDVYPSAENIYRFLDSYIDQNRVKVDAQSQKEYAERKEKEDQKRSQQYCVWAYYAECVRNEYKSNGYLAHNLKLNHLNMLLWVLTQIRGNDLVSRIKRECKLPTDYLDPLKVGSVIATRIKEDVQQRPNWYKESDLGLAITIEALFDTMNAKELHEKFISVDYNYQNFYNQKVQQYEQNKR